MNANQFSILYGLGLVGVCTLAVTLLIDPGTFSLPEEVHELSLPLQLIAFVVQPAVILAVAVAGGLWVTSSVPFQSHLISSNSLAKGVVTELRPAFLIGVSVGIVILLIEFALGGMPESIGILGTDHSLDSLLFSIPARMLYGGITEELIARWGVMSVVAYGLWQLTKTGSSEFTPAIVWTSIIVAGIVFAVLHLPMAGTTVDGGLDPTVLAWVLLANTVAGIAYGWLFWQYSLEAAMIAHASTHVFWVTVSGLLLAW